MAAVVGLHASLAECMGRQKPAPKSKFRWLFIEISTRRGFWKAALRKALYFTGKVIAHPCRVWFLWHFPTSDLVMVGRAAPGSQLHRNVVATYIDPLIAFVSANAWLAYLTLFLAALLEAVPVVGSVIPGSTIIIALSALVPGGELKLGWVLLAAIAGALLGDGSAFWVGHRAQRGILSSWPLTSYPRVVAQSEDFFRRFGTWAVFFARFVPPIRAFVPVTAGALGMPPARFYGVNIPAILVWAPLHVLPGVMAVSLLDRLGVFEHTGGSAKHHWMPIVIGAALIIALAVWTIRRRHGGGIIEPAPQRIKDLR